MLNDLPSIGFLGPEGTFSHLSYLTFFKKSNNVVINFPSITHLFDALSINKVDFLLIPIENNLYGSVREVLNAFINLELQIHLELILPIHHYLYTYAPKLEDIKQIYSHEQPLGQCNNWIKKKLPFAQLISTNSTISAIKQIKTNHSKAIIASPLVKKIYHLPIKNRNIEDIHGNETRFLLISKNKVKYDLSKLIKKNKLLNKEKKTTELKSSIILSLKDEPGALAKILNIFAKYYVNLTRIESSIAKKASFKYFFFIDFLTLKNTTKTETVLQEIKKNSKAYQFLGYFKVIK